MADDRRLVTVEYLEEYAKGLNIPSVDQTYNPTSENAQSGKAVSEALSGYVVAEVGKGLSSNDFTDEDKEKLDSALQGEDLDQAYTPDSENAQSGKAVAEAVSTEQKRSDNTFANALKGTKSGTAILLDDVSPVTHDMSVKVMSKNLIPFPYYNFPLGEIIVNGLTFITYEDGSILVNGTSEATTHRYLYRNTKDLLGLKTGDTIAFSWALSDNTTDINAYCNYFDSAAAIQSSGMQLSKTMTSFTVTITDDWIGFAIYIIFKAGVTYNNLLIKPQLELGTTATAYTPYVPDLTAVKVKKSNAFGEIVAEYTPTADGTVNGVTSLYPNTTLMTDTEGVLIDCEYNRDINKFSGAVDDVQINGASIVSDGVANIPTIGKEQYGVAKLMGDNGSFGINYNENAGLYVVKAENSNITNRANDSRPITSTNLDYAVKAAMCDGKGAAWTADEQAAGERIGIRNLELLSDLTVAEDVGSFSMSGLDLNRILIDIELSTIPSAGVMIQIYIQTPVNNLIYIGRIAQASGNRRIIINAEYTKPFIVVNSIFSNNPTNANSIVNSSPPIYCENNIKGFMLTFDLYAGSKIKVFGVK